MSGLVDPGRCPVCAHPNECAVAKGKGVCWCFSRPVPQPVIDQIPAEARDLACVCQSCAFGRRSPERAAEQLKEILRRRG